MKRLSRLPSRQQPAFFGWFAVGLGLKRWALLTVFGTILVILGAALAFAFVALDFSLKVVDVLDHLSGRFLDTVALGTMFLTLGIVAIVVGVRGVFKAVERVYAKETRRDFLDVARSRKRLDSAERVVALGGGTGLSTMLRGLKEHSSNITAIVTMADDGGSTGKLREHGMLPPGDLRSCIAALAEAEPLMTDLFQYRFKGLGELQGHSLGNLFMAAMFEKTGDFDLAVREVSKVLAIRGQVLPSTLDDIRLGAELHDGTLISGQSNVNHSRDIARAFLVPDNPRALPGAVKAIQEAEVIIIGPGSLFTSIIPNLLVPEIAAAIKASDAPKIYVCNVMTQPEETCNFQRGGSCARHHPPHRSGRGYARPPQLGQSSRRNPRALRGDWLRLHRARRNRNRDDGRARHSRPVHRCLERGQAPPRQIGGGDFPDRGTNLEKRG